MPINDPIIVVVSATAIPSTMVLISDFTGRSDNFVRVNPLNIRTDSGITPPSRTKTPGIMGRNFEGLT